LVLDGLVDFLEELWVVEADGGVGVVVAGEVEGVFLLGDVEGGVFVLDDEGGAVLVGVVVGYVVVVLLEVVVEGSEDDVHGVWTTLRIFSM